MVKITGETCRTRRIKSEINVVPYIDVMLVLLIIFMATAPMLETGVDIDMPQASAKPLEKEDDVKPLIISVDSGGLMYASNNENPAQPVDDAQLIVLIENKITAEPKAQVMIKGDRNALNGQVVQAMVLAQKAGVKKVGIMTAPEANQSK